MAATTKTKHSATVRISEQSRRYLREMAAQSGEPMQAVLDMALEQHRRQRFWEDMKTAYAAIESDPNALAAEKKEFALFEGTLMDGLDPCENWTDEHTNKGTTEAATPQLRGS